MISKSTNTKSVTMICREHPKVTRLEFNEWFFSDKKGNLLLKILS